MASFTGWARTNFFSVKPKKQQEFRRWAAKMGLLLATQTERGKTEYCLMAVGGEGWPGYDPTAEEEGQEITGFGQQVSRFLSPGSVAIMVEAGAEGLAYVGGYAVAVDHKGVEVGLRLSTIEELARRKWPKAKISKPARSG